MDQDYRPNVWWKAAAFWAVFMVLYLAYRFFPVFPLCLICGTVESIFQHAKAGFYSYLIVSAVEYAAVRSRIADRGRFLFSRMSATVFLPWVIFLLWYTVPAIVGRFPDNVHEIVYANIVTYLVGVVVVVLEGGWQRATYDGRLRALLIALFLISILLNTIFTYRLPWTDVFVEPDWR